MNHPNAYQPDEHDEVVLLLPWYVNGSLDGYEHTRVRRHLGHCLTCRRELASLRSMASAVAAAPVIDFSSQAAHARFMSRLPPRNPQAASPAAPFKRPTARRRFRPALRAWAVAAAVMLLALPLGIKEYGGLWRADFRTLSDAPPEVVKPKADLTLVFDKQLTAERIDALMREVGGTVVDGPNAVGAYAVRLGEGKPADPAAALAYLRGQEGILLAEPALKAH